MTLPIDPMRISDLEAAWERVRAGRASADARARRQARQAVLRAAPLLIWFRSRAQFDPSTIPEYSGKLRQVRAHPSAIETI
jgi:hypothetical protein